jgi:Spy/CpxP family protein refolding chaperone
MSHAPLGHTLLVAVLLSLGVAGSPPDLAAQGPPSGGDPLAEMLFEPELIMQHRRAIDLTNQQRDAISALIQDLQGQVVDLQWTLLEQMEDLSRALEAPRVDLDRALDRMNAVLGTEQRIKRAHLTLLVRIKNLLRPDQQDALRRLRGDPR